MFLQHSTGIDKLGFLVHKSPCSQKQVQENLYTSRALVLLVTLGGTSVPLIVYLALYQMK